MQEQIKKQAWAFCKAAIYTPQAYGYYEKPKKQKYIRKSTTFDKHKKFDRNRYVRKPPNRNCKCFICGDINHLANRCPNKNKDNRSRERNNLIEQIGDFEIEQIKKIQIIIQFIVFIVKKKKLK